MKVHQTIIYQSLNFLTSSTENLHGVRNIGLGNCLLAADPFEVRRNKMHEEPRSHGST